jgi:hypothetical protein
MNKEGERGPHGEKPTPEEARKKAEEIIQRVRSDEHFRQGVEKDPIKTLVGAGVSEPAAEDIARESNLAALPCTHTCWWTCWWTDWLSI